LASIFDEEHGAGLRFRRRSDLRCGWLGQDDAWRQERDDEKDTECDTMGEHAVASLSRSVPGEKPSPKRIPVSFRLTSRLASQVPDDAPNGETVCAESIKRMSSKNIFHYPLYHASRK
jgi:hypothetical protein